MTEPTEKDPIVIRNRYLDDAQGLRRAALGRSSLRINKGSTRTPLTPAAPRSAAPAAASSAAAPASGFGIGAVAARMLAAENV